MLKPLLPIVNDWWSHEFKKIEHIAVVHAKYGSNHLQKELADTGSENNLAKNQNGLKSENQALIHLTTQTSKYNFDIDKSNIKYLFFKLAELPSVLLAIQGPPPKFS